MDLIDEIKGLGPPGFQLLLAKLVERNVVDPASVPPELADFNTRVAGLYLVVKSRHQDWAMNELCVCLEQVQSMTGPVPRVRVGIDSLAELLKVGPLGASIRSSAEEVSTLKQQIAVVARLKQLHEHLQRLENTFIPLQRSLRMALQGLQRDEIPDWETLRFYVTEVRRTYEALKYAAAGASMNAEFGPCLDKLSRSTQDLEAMLATEKLDARCSDALARIKWIVDRQPTQINGSLVEGSRHLRLHVLVEIMQKVLRRAEELHINGPATVHLRSLGEGIRNLTEVRATLDLHVNCHDLLQFVDDQLRMMASYLSREKAGDALAIGDIRVVWEDLQPQLLKVSAPLETDTLEALRRASTSVQAALDALDESRIRSSFREYRDLFVQCFNRIDRGLLDLCHRLMLMEDPLAKVVSELQAA